MWDKTKSSQQNNLIDTDNRVVVSRGEGGRGRTKRVAGGSNTWWQKETSLWVGSTQWGEYVSVVL